MSAEVLRKAAALMRERAASVNYTSPWSVSGGGGTCAVRCNDGRNYVASTYGGVGTEEAAAEHIASWHPLVAVAVADWLDAQADLHDWFVSRGSLRDFDVVDTDRSALAVATAYLGSDA